MAVDPDTGRFTAKAQPCAIADDTPTRKTTDADLAIKLATLDTRTPEPQPSFDMYAPKAQGCATGNDTPAPTK